jgi:dTDP-4-amino-4,6-dideoxygalactose transaminase
MVQEVPFFNYPALFRKDESEYLKLLKDVLGRGAYIMQKDLAEFEQNLADYLDIKHVVGVADGTNAIKLSLMAAGVGQDDEVIVPSHTYVASAAAIHYVQARPVFVECGADHMIDETSIETAITSKTKAIMPVQLNGRTSRMDVICKIAEDHGLQIIEDSAQALGSKFRGISAGGFGAAGTSSFYPAKLLGCFGDGGAVLTNRDDIAEKVKLLRDHGRDENGEVVAWGTNSRLDNMQAAVLNLKLKTFPKDVERRREIAAMYQSGLENLQSLILPPAPDADPDHYDVYQNYEVEADKRDELKVFLQANGVGSIIQFGGKPVHQYPLDFGGSKNLPFTEGLYKRLLLLPMHTALSNEDVEYVISQTQKFYS